MSAESTFEVSREGTLIGAATADPEIADLRRNLHDRRLKDTRMVAESLSAKQALCSDLTVERATDLLWALGSAEMYRMLAVDRGWSSAQYEQWLASSLHHALL